ncbi:TPR repeat-containing protein T20B12.1 [Toxocara canis]|uniref:TPR repeat-containing protein T20B12.1 n=1 Tax=Toxocara canis TaxID=6265 RepID=A0A0B2W0P1_TOXCA|nr:TPR repeat-containing protein T20B12.1 [Toxocara canis]
MSGASFSWWEGRSYVIVVKYISFGIHEQYFTSYSHIEEERIFSSEQNDNVTCEFLLERFYARLYYYEYSKAETYLNEAIGRANLDMELCGVLGKRTKFQRVNIPQLIAKASSSMVTDRGRSQDDEEWQSIRLPTNVLLDDDTLLENVSVLEASEGKARFQPVQLACILARCAFEASTQHNDQLLRERCSAYVDKVISEGCNWAVQASALLWRCTLEKENKRRVQRSCLQAEHLAKLMDAFDDPEALKFNYEHAKMWENYLLLCVDTNDFAGAIRALHRLLDLKGKHEDDEVLEAVVAQIMKFVKSKDDSANHMKKEMCKLLARMASKQTFSPKIWRCYAALVQPGNEDRSIEHHEKYLHLLERAYLADHTKQNWYSEEEQCCVVLNAAVDVLKQKQRLAELNNTDPTDMASKLRVTARPLVAIVEKTYGIDASSATSNTLKSALADVKGFITNADAQRL